MTNDEIDAAILRHLSTGPLPFGALLILMERDAGYVDLFRPVDRRLQALRKAGKVTPSRRIGWSLAVGSGGSGA